MKDTLQSLRPLKNLLLQLVAGCPIFFHKMTGLLEPPLTQLKLTAHVRSLRFGAKGMEDSVRRLISAIQKRDSFLLFVDIFSDFLSDI